MYSTRRAARTLADLFDGRNQLIVYHFMLGPGWDGCPSCFFLADHSERREISIWAQRDVTLAVVSRERARRGCAAMEAWPEVRHHDRYDESNEAASAIAAAKPADCGRSD